MGIEPQPERIRGLNAKAYIRDVRYDTIDRVSFAEVTGWHMQFFVVAINFLERRIVDRVNDLQRTISV